MTTDKLYPEQDHPALGDFYIRHVMAMTAEGLHAKSDIAAQLAWRDAEIARLQAQVAELQSSMLRAYSDGRLDEASSAAGLRALNGSLKAQVDAAKSDASLMRSIHAQAMESNGRTIASHLGTIQDLRAQVDALAGALKQASTAIDGLQDSIFGSRRNRTPDAGGWYSEPVHVDDMSALGAAKEAATAALAASGR